VDERGKWMNVSLLQLIHFVSMPVGEEPTRTSRLSSQLDFSSKQGKAASTATWMNEKFQLGQHSNPNPIKALRGGASCFFFLSPNT